MISKAGITLCKLHVGIFSRKVTCFKNYPLHLGSSRWQLELPI